MALRTIGVLPRVSALRYPRYGEARLCQVRRQRKRVDASVLMTIEMR
jgi:hypothetical protein